MGSNHAMLTEKALILMYYLMNKIKVKIYIIKEHMIKFKRLTYYKFPYVILISKFLEHF